MADSAKRQQAGGRKPGRPKGSTSSGKKQTGTKKSTKKSRQSVKEENSGFMRAEVIIICSFAAALLLFLSNFRLCGLFGEYLRAFQLGLFGALGYVIPLVLFTGTCFYLSNQGNMVAAVKLGAAVTAVLTICGLFQLFFGGSVPEGSSLLTYYKVSSVNGAGGGLIGGLLISALGALLGRIGAGLVLIVLFIISMVLITERSFISMVKKGGHKAGQYAKEDLERRREIHARRMEERRISGVNLEATDLTKKASKEEPVYDEEAFDREFGQELPPILESSPADEFHGRFDPPLDTQNFGEAGSLAKELEQHSRTGGAVGSRVREQEEKRPSDEMLEEEALPVIRAGRDSRTLEEMDVMQRHPVSFEADLSSGSRLPDSQWEAVQEAEEEPPVKENTAPWEEDIFKGQEEPEEEVQAGNAAGGPEDSWEQVFYEPEQPAAPEAQSRGMEEPEEPAYEASDSIFVPEETKRVVTASGKVIETETELLRKKLEKKEPVQREISAESGAVQGTGSASGPVKKEEPKREYVFPPTTLLKKGVKKPGAFSENEYKSTAIKLQQTLKNFGVGVTVTNISCGPSVTRYELLPEQGVKVSRIVSLTDDIKLSLAAADIRIEAPIPGKSAVGIEVPNKENNIVYLRELLETEAFKNHRSNLAFAVGKDIGGQAVVTDIAKMPHLLIAGATGSGKSVCINTLIMSVIYKAKPEDVKLIMVDPKVVELSVYNGIPHLLIPVVTDPKKASGALNWAVAEMDSRYKKFAECNVRDLKGYNQRVEKVQQMDVQNKPEKLPQIIIIIDELADLMMVAPGEVEDSICRLAQLARAAGIHLVIATQRPSVNVITGLIKANVPSRIAFSVSSGVDSRTIIDMNGAEKLLGKGDMLFYPAGYPKPQRVQGAFVSDDEVGNVVEFLKEQGMTAQYNPEVESRVSSPLSDSPGSAERDEYFVQAGQFIIEKDKASIGMLQRMFKIGFNRAARIMDQLADAGVVGEEEGTKPRKVLMSQEQFEEMLEQGL